MGASHFVELFLLPVLAGLFLFIFSEFRQWALGKKIVVGTVVIAAAFAGSYEISKIKGGALKENTREEHWVLAGTVVDADSNGGIAQAEIAISGEGAAYYTEDTGNFRIRSNQMPPSTSLRIRVTKKGYKTLDRSVEPNTENLILPLQKQ